MKHQYREGDWFVVPLSGGGLAIGLVARAKGGVILGYFFGPRRDAVPTVSELTDLRPENAKLVRMFGHLGLVQGRWPIIGVTPTWDRRCWPMPAFGREESLTGRSWRVTYPDDDPSARPRETPISPEERERLPKDVLSGAGAVEALLAHLLML